MQNITFSIYDGHGSISFGTSLSQRMENIRKHYAVIKGVSSNNVVLQYERKVVRDSDTPASLGMSHSDTVMATLAE